MSFPAHGKISKATKDLSNASKIVERRNCSQALKKLLSDSNIRSRFANEAAIAARDKNKSTHQILSKIYSNAIKAAINCAQKTLDSSTKEKNEDIIFPFRIFTLVDKDTDAALASIKKERQAGFDECEPFTFEHFERYRNTNQNLTFVQPRVIQELLKYCLDCLENEDICGLAEAELLNLLHKLCSRPDYVAHIHPNQYMIEILTAVQIRLLRSMDSVKMCEYAAKAFYYLVHQFTVALGMDISGFVQPVLALVVDWVRTCSSRASSGNSTNSSEILKWMYGVAIDILSAYPDQCVSVLGQNNYGKDLFGYCRSRWLVSKDDHKEALVGYFSSHLYVCEVAGNQQGLFSGDLGQVGTATLDGEKLGYLKDMLLSEKNLEAFPSMATLEVTETSQSKGQKKRRKTGTGTQQENFCPLSRRQRKYLELCARILRCSQRLHLAEWERSMSKNLDDILVNECLNGSSRGLGSDDIVDNLSASPWVSCVATASFGSVISLEMKETASSMEYASHSPADMQPSQTSEISTNPQNDEFIQKLPMLLAIDQDVVIELDDAKVIVYLQIISASAEVFPRGECWSSVNKWHEINYSPFHDSRVETGKIVTYCNACSVRDLAAIVYSLSLILVRYGGANGSVQVQMWTLVCLLKMTESSHISCKYSTEKEDRNELTVAWRCVWKRLFQADLRYQSSTSHADSSSVGEMVLMLLTEIARGSLVEFDFSRSFVQSTYLRRHQSKIWNLPIYSTAVDVKISAPFELASAIIRRSGLVEGDSDCICSKVPDKMMQKLIRVEAEKGQGRRFRLANFCLQFVSHAVKEKDLGSLNRVGMFCSELLCSLMDSRVTNLTTFSIKAFREMKITDGIYDASCLHSVVTMKSEVFTKSSLDLLWKDSLIPFWSQNIIDADRSVWMTMRGAPNCPFWSSYDRSWLAAKIASTLTSKSSHCPIWVASDLKEFGLKSLSNILHHPATPENSISTSFCPIILSCKASVSKVMLAVALGGDDLQKVKAPWGSVDYCIQSVINEAILKASELRQYENEFASTFIDLIGIIRLLRSLLSTEVCAKSVGDILPLNLSTNLYKSCKKIVRSYGKRLNHGKTTSLSEATDMRSLKDADSDFDPSDDNNLEGFATSSKQLSNFSRSSESELDKFDCEDEFQTRSKRKRPSEDRKETNRYSKASHERPSIGCHNARHLVCFWICASIMIQLDPSAECGNEIADTILWPQEASGDVNTALDSDEPHDFLLLLNLLYQFASFGQNEKHDTIMSPINLCGDVILQCRAVCDTSSPLYFWGFKFVILLMSKALKTFSYTLSVKEREQIQNILYPRSIEALRALQNRPRLRYSQVIAAAKCFLLADSEFNGTFSKAYAKYFVLKTLKEQHKQTRVAGIEALGVALIMFPRNVQKKIADDALATFPSKPILFENTTRKGSFKQWVDEKVAGLDDVDNKRRSWEENRFAIEADKLACLGMIGKNTSDDQLALKIITDLFLISEDPKWTLAAFHHLEGLAKHRRYGSTEEMLRSTQMHLFGQWMKREKDLCKLPASFTLPSLLRGVMRLDLESSTKSHDRKGSNRDFYASSIFEHAADEFIFQNSSFIVPFVLIGNIDSGEDVKGIIAKSSKNHSDISEDMSYLGNIVSDVATVCTNGEVESMIKSHFHYIYSHLIPLFITDDNLICQKAQDFLHSISSIFQNVRKQIKKSSSLIALELLMINMNKYQVSPFISKFPDKFLESGLVYLTKNNSDNANQINKPGLFQCNSTSATECILDMKLILDQAEQPICRLEAWNTIDAIVEIVQADSKGYELGFCVTTLLSICRSMKDDVLRLSILDRLEKIIEDINKKEADKEGKLDMKVYASKIVSCLVQIHEEYQQELIEFFLSSWKTQNIRSRLSSSLINQKWNDLRSPLQDSVYNNETNYFEIINSAATEVVEGTAFHAIKCISRTHDVIALVLSNNTAFAADVQESLDPFPEPEIEEATLNALEKFNEKCCLTSIKQQFDELRDQRQDVDYRKKIRTFLHVASRFRASENRNLRQQELSTTKESYASSPSKSLLSPEVRSLISALTRLNTDLQTFLKSERDESIENLLGEIGKELFELCAVKYPLEVQIASFRCIGNIGLLPHDFDTQIQQSSRHKESNTNPLPEIYSSVFELLAKTIQAHDIHTAISAKNTVKSLMSTQDGLKSYKSTKFTSETQRLLSPFDNDFIGIGTANDLSDEFLDKLLGRVNKTREDLKVGHSWCWDDALWVPAGNISFNAWIKYIVCALIMCCYRDKNERIDTSTKPIKGASDFFPACLSLSSRDHQFAATIFPGIIYDLLYTDSSDNLDMAGTSWPRRQYMVGAPLSATNQFLTRCFGAVISMSTSFGNTENESANGDPNQNQNYSQFFRLIIETLDMLRITTELGFSRTQLKRNVVSPRKNRSRRVSESNYNSDLSDSPEWSGRPYGVVLHLAGIELARACTETKDFASALYYAELFADCRLGGSGSIFERIDSIKVCESSISGFGIPIGETNPEINSPCDKIDLAVDLHNILRICFSELHEDEALIGLEDQISSIRFQRPECFEEGIPQFHRMESPSDLIHGLMGLDTRAQLKSRQSSARERLALSTGLQQLGLRDVSTHYLVGANISGLFPSQDAYKRIEDEWAEDSWRLLQWDEVLPKVQNKPPPHIANNNPDFSSDYRPGFNVSFKNTLTSLMEEDFPAFATHLHSTRFSLLSDLHNNVGQSAPIMDINGYALRAFSINQLEDLGTVYADCDKMSISFWLNKHCTTMTALSTSKKETTFKDLECAFAVHEVSLRILLKKFGDSGNVEIVDRLSAHLWSVCSIARERNRPNVASSALERLRSSSKMKFIQIEHESIGDCLPRMQHSFEEAKILHCVGNTAAAVRLCKEIMKKLKSAEKMTKEICVLLITTKVQCAEWLIGYPIESNNMIQKDLLQPAAELSEKLHKATRINSSLVSSTHFALGNFVYGIYNKIQKRVNSQEWKMLGQAAVGRQKQKEKLELLIHEMKKNKTREYVNAHGQLKALQKEVGVDMNERKEVEESVFTYLKLSINSYGTALSQCSSDKVISNEVIFRFISLWFNNSHISGTDIDDIVLKFVLEIPSYHFVPITYQIFSRIDSSKKTDRTGNAFQTVLQNLICKICREHPYHGLIQLIALSNGNNVERTRYANEFSTDEKKVKSILQLMRRVKTTAPPFVSGLLESYELVSNAYIALAMEPTENLVILKTKKISYAHTKIEPNLWLHDCLKHTSLPRPCVFTAPPTIRPGADYGDGSSDPVGSERIQTFDTLFSLTDTGLHRPKIINCKGTKGGTYKQLVKGDDDIRQDAVMQQVFSTMNVFLRNQRHQSPGNSKLRLRTYSCIPLSPAAGVIEWVDNTIPIGNYLLYSKGAHSRYYPGEWRHSICSEFMAKSPSKILRASFDEVCNHHSPALRFFFLERFSHSPQLWHTARMSYTRSCAVNSMVGHILGIGDRHCLNILIHEETGEVVHIDFGFVFEQGKFQTTPETVPFRLTRNIVDGMGPTGTEGLFTTSARATTKVLRDNSSALLTVLSAVVSDPLYKWNINMTDPTKYRQEEENAPGIAENQNDAATRAIGRINEKLKGYEEGTFGEQQTIEGQVRLLINEARDPNNLCRLFPGWGAWV